MVACSCNPIIKVAGEDRQVLTACWLASQAEMMGFPFSEGWKSGEADTQCVTLLSALIHTCAYHTHTHTPSPQVSQDSHTLPESEFSFFPVWKRDCDGASRREEPALFHWVSLCVHLVELGELHNVVREFEHVYSLSLCSLTDTWSEACSWRVLVSFGSF